MPIAIVVGAAPVVMFTGKKFDVDLDELPSPGSSGRPVPTPTRTST
jgi:hypothetical protein